MKKLIITTLLASCLVLPALAQNTNKVPVSLYPRITLMDSNYLFWLAATNVSPHTNYSVSYGSILSNVLSAWSQFTGPSYQPASPNLSNQASGSVNGWLSSVDWNTFNGKQNANSPAVMGATNTSGSLTLTNQLNVNGSVGVVPLVVVGGTGLTNTAVFQNALNAAYVSIGADGGLSVGTLTLVGPGNIKATGNVGGATMTAGQLSIANWSTPTAVNSNDFWLQFGNQPGVTNHIMRVVSGILSNYWSMNGTNVYGKQLAP